MRGVFQTKQKVPICDKPLKSFQGALQDETYFNINALLVRHHEPTG